jgi:hypothetical protein
MPPIEKFNKLLEILDEIDDNTLSTISKLSNLKKEKLFNEIKNLNLLSKENLNQIIKKIK